MKFKAYLPVVIVAGILALVPVALWLASIFYFVLHKLSPFGAGFWSWVDYVMRDETDRAVQLKALGIAVFTTYLVIPYLLALLFEKRVPLHGEARFANGGEIAKADLYADSGFIVGKYNGRFLRFPGPRFVSLAAPTRSGKGVGVVIPNCLEYEESLVVLDLKRENFNKTATWRQQGLGQEVYLFNPFAGEPDDDNGPPEALITHCWNPLDALPGGFYRIGEVMNIGRIFWPSTGGKEDFWNDGARDLFVGIVLFLSELKDRRGQEIGEHGKSDLPDYPVSFGEVLRQANGRGTGKTGKDHLKGMVAEFSWLSSQCRDLLASFAGSTDDVGKSTADTLKRPLGLWMNPIVDAATSKSDFKLTDVRKKKMTIYLGIPANRLEDAARLINLFFSQLVSLNTRKLPEDDPRLKYVCGLIMDEFTALGRINVIAKGISYIAGYNLRLMPIFQSYSQLVSVYGKEDACTIRTNVACNINFAPRDEQDAREISEALGTYTLKNDSRSRSVGARGGGSISTSDQRRALLMPQEVKEIGMWKEIIFLENVKPIFCEKIKYYADPYFNDRILPPPAIPELKVEEFLARQENRLREVTDADIDYGELRLVDPPGASGLQLINECGQCFSDYGDPIDEEKMFGDVGQLMIANGMAADAVNVLKKNKVNAAALVKAATLEKFENDRNGARIAETGSYSRPITSADLAVFALPGDEYAAIEADDSSLPPDSELKENLPISEASTTATNENAFAGFAATLSTHAELDDEPMEVLE